MGEGLLHRLISELLRAQVAAWLAERKVRGCVGANQFIYYREHAPTVSVAPDVYVLPGVDPALTFSSWKTWERGIVPSFAFECVSDDWLKDYRDGPPKYDELGAAELVIFDPEHTVSPAERMRWQVWRRFARRGLVRAAATNEDRVRAKVLGCWLRAVGAGDSLRVRLATGPRGDSLLPTDAERERQRADRERQRAETAERELARLRAERGIR